MSKAIPILILLSCVTGVRTEEIDPEPPGGGAELRKLRGTWKVTKLLVEGKEVSSPLTMTYTIEGEKLTVDNGTQKWTMKVKIDSKKKPFVIEMIHDKAKTSQASHYQIEKGEWRIAVGSASKGGKAPTAFDGASGPVLVLMRQKQ
jgi:uncharacterized protein (TIGR03067 family)